MKDEKLISVVVGLFLLPYVIYLIIKDKIKDKNVKNVLEDSGLK